MIDRMVGREGRQYTNSSPAYARDVEEIHWIQIPCRTAHLNRKELYRRLVDALLRRTDLRELLLTILPSCDEQSGVVCVVKWPGVVHKSQHLSHETYQQ